MNQFFDTHAHIQFANYGLDGKEVWKQSQEAGVTRMLVVGCDLESSQRALGFAAAHENVWAVVGVHPHEAKDYASGSKKLDKLRALAESEHVVAIGETGLDYYYENSPKDQQFELLRWHLQLASKLKLPVVLHVREAFEDFWPIFDDFQGLSGVVHCFTGTAIEAEEALSRGLYIALNGIMTFTRVESQLEAARKIPLKRLLLETDAPYLTPKPFRGKICKPEHVKYTAAFLAELRGETIEHVATATTDNAVKLFKVK